MDWVKSNSVCNHVQFILSGRLILRHSSSIGAFSSLKFPWISESTKRLFSWLLGVSPFFVTILTGSLYLEVWMHFIFIVWKECQHHLFFLWYLSVKVLTSTTCLDNPKPLRLLFVALQTSHEGLQIHLIVHLNKLFTKIQVSEKAGVLASP